MTKQKILLMNVGTTERPLEICINEQKPDFVYLIHSNGTEENAISIVNKCKLNKNQFKLVNLKNKQDLFQDCYIKVLEICDQIDRDKYDIFVDYTGGTKSMVAGLILGTLNERCIYYYTGSVSDDGRNPEERGIVKDGYELIHEQINPYTVFAVREVEKAKEFFNNYQFLASKSYFDSAIAIAEDEDSKRFAELCCNIVKLYNEWDKFSNKLNMPDENSDNVSKPFLNSFLKREIIDNIDGSENFKKLIIEDNPNFYNQLKNNQEFLNKKLANKGKLSENVNFYLADILNNASRRIEEGKYDDAVARLYRTIELISQSLLLELGLINEKNLNDKKEFIIPIKKFNNASGETEEFLMKFDDYRNNKNNLRIGLKNSFKLLDVLGCNIATRYLDDNEINNNITSRNSSILAHGLKNVDEHTASNLFKQVLDYAREVFPDVEKYMDMAKFPKFDIE